MSSKSSPIATSPNENGNNNDSFNSRLLWPDMITLPTNKWYFTKDEVIERLNQNPAKVKEIKKNMELCLMYFYTMKKILKLFDHTYTASCILFFRYWYIYDIPFNLQECTHLSLAILVTACKTMENNRPMDNYIQATSEFIIKNIINVNGKRTSVNQDKLKWEIKDKLINKEKEVLCKLGFDLNLKNPKELIEDIFGNFYKYNRDNTLPDDFKKIFPKIIQESRNFIIQAITQPISLLFNGYEFILIALIFCGIQYKKIVDPNFKFPKNFFKERFPIKFDPLSIETFFAEYKVIEDSFFDLKSNKSDKLLIKKEEIDSILQEDLEEGDKDIEQTSIENTSIYDYDKIKSGIVHQDLLDATEKRLKEMYEKLESESPSKRPRSDNEGNDFHNSPKPKVQKI